MSGLRQRDPLPPFLFLLVVDILSSILSKCVVGKILETFEVGNVRVALSHLQFVDATFFFLAPEMRIYS